LLQALPAAKTAVKQKVNIKWLLHDEENSIIVAIEIFNL